jgi:hypothetical protein|tara:strand:+ start:541 stop:840 length:300 start_codon:yes stop_codon:yes gene_type:complete
MKKSLIILLILGSILFYLIYESYQFKIESTNKDINKDIKYYDNNIHIGKVLSDKLKKSGTLEEEQVNSMKVNFYKTTNGESPRYQPVLPSLEGTSNIDD